MPCARKLQARPDLPAPYFTINLTGIKADFKVDSVRSGHDMKNVVASLKREIQPFVPFRNATEGVPYRA